MRILFSLYPCQPVIIIIIVVVVVVVIIIIISLDFHHDDWVT